MSLASIPGLKTYSVPPGLTDKERDEFFAECSRDTDRIREEKRKENTLKTPERERIQYDYKTKLGMDDIDIPQFMKNVFIHPVVETSEKDFFADDFCPRYFNNEQYRTDNEGRFLFFENGKINRIIDSMNELDPNVLSHKLLIKIGKQNLTPGFYKKCYKLNDFNFTQTSGEKIFNVRRISPFEVTCFTNIELKYEGYASSKRLIDTGCSVSTLPTDELWNYKTCKFITSELEDKLFFASTMEDIETCNGIKSDQFIYLKSPLYISLDGLNFVTINVFTVSLDEKNKDPPLIGMDIISQYTMIFSMFDGKYQLRISDQREEI